MSIPIKPEITRKVSGRMWIASCWGNLRRALIGGKEHYIGVFRDDLQNKESGAVEL